MKKIENSECLTDFGKFIRDKRESLNMYQTDVAAAAGISQSYYSHIESGMRNVDLVLAMKICQVLKLNLNDYIKEYMK